MLKTKSRTIFVWFKVTFLKLLGGGRGAEAPVVSHLIMFS